MVCVTAFILFARHDNYGRRHQIEDRCSKCNCRPHKMHSRTVASAKCRVGWVSTAHCWSLGQSAADRAQVRRGKLRDPRTQAVVGRGRACQHSRRFVETTFAAVQSMILLTGSLIISSESRAAYQYAATKHNYCQVAGCGATSRVGIMQYFVDFVVWRIVRETECLLSCRQLVYHSV